MDAATHDIADRGMPRDAAHGIARAFLPASRWGNRYHYHYVQAKLRTDPLYPRVVAELRDGEWPLLDLGCGLGLLVHALRGDGQRQPYLGVDVDTAKLQRATRASALAGLAGVRFAQHELARDPLPAHLGAVALLDVLQYLPASAQHALLAQAVARLAPGAPLVIRVPLARDRARSRFTRLADHIGHASGWMRTAPRDYPSGEALQAILAGHGLQAECRPLRGRTPFDNWLLVARQR